MFPATPFLVSADTSVPCLLLQVSLCLVQLANCPQQTPIDMRMITKQFVLIAAQCSLSQFGPLSPRVHSKGTEALSLVWRSAFDSELFPLTGVSKLSISLKLRVLIIFSWQLMSVEYSALNPSLDNTNLFTETLLFKSLSSKHQHGTQTLEPLFPLFPHCSCPTSVKRFEAILQQRVGGRYLCV